MKIQPRRQSTRTAIALVCAGIVVTFLGWLYVAYHYQQWPFSSASESTKSTNAVDYSKPSSNQTKAGTQIKEDSAEKAKAQDTSGSGSTAPQATTIDITAANKSNDTLMIRTLIQKVTNSGECVLSMTGPSGMSYSATSGVQAMASTSTCKGFNVPLSALAPGNWTINIEFNDGSDKSTTKTEVSL
jgi:cytoskeletal protein RodZ